MTNFAGTSADGTAYMWSAAWATSHDAVTGVSAETTSTQIQLAINNSSFQIRRGFLYFDTSALGASALISAASLWLYCTDNAVKIVAMKGTQNAALVTADFDAFTGSAYSSVTPGTWGWCEIPFNQQGMDDINKTGTTKISIRESDHDYDDVTPIALTVANFRSSNYADPAFHPYLAVTYTTGWSAGDFLGVANANIGKIMGVSKASIGKVIGV